MLGNSVSITSDPGKTRDWQCAIADRVFAEYQDSALRHRNVSQNDRVTYPCELRRLVTKKAEWLCANERRRETRIFSPPRGT